jgi:hypothetical protein
MPQKHQSINVFMSLNSINVAKQSLCPSHWIDMSGFLWVRSDGLFWWDCCFILGHSHKLMFVPCDNLWKELQGCERFPIAVNTWRYDLALVYQHGSKICEKSGSHLKIPHARRVIWRRFHTVGQQFLSDALCWVHVHWSRYLHFRKTTIIIILKVHPFKI